LGLPFYNSARAEASEFKFGMQFGFTKTHHKITPRGKVGVAMGWGAPRNWRFPLVFLQRLKVATLKLAG